MQISVSNIVFVSDVPQKGKDRLVAVFAVSFTEPTFADPQFSVPVPETVTIQDFRYYRPEEGDGYISVPAIKTKHGIVRPVAVTQGMRSRIYSALVEAWNALPKPPETTAMRDSMPI